jgi:hypothetical protein
VRLFKIGMILSLDLENEDVGRDGWSQFIGWMKEFSYDAYVDYPLGLGDIYKYLDRAFQGSKFILTMRDPASYTSASAIISRTLTWN